MNYPFTAIVGQEKLKKALLLCAINPAIGGLLIQGDKGTAKSTAARALAEVVPPITKSAYCQFNCREDNAALICEVCNTTDQQWVQAEVPFINLPLGATEERILGSLDLGAVLTDRKKKFQPGLLASVHQGILYIDEVNLLSDHLVDILLDVAAMGENIIEREGLSISHPSQFTLIGTMNPEEGQLRPQFLDRFGLMVRIEAPAEVNERTEVVRRRIAFEADSVLFSEHWAAEQQALQAWLLKAKQLLPGITLADELLNLISSITIELNVKSLRADIVMYKTAITLAALAHREEVTAEDIREAAVLALAHRSRKNPSEALSSASASPHPEQNTGSTSSEKKNNNNPTATNSQVKESDLKKDNGPKNSDHQPQVRQKDEDEGKVDQGEGKVADRNRQGSNEESCNEEGNNREDNNCDGDHEQEKEADKIFGAGSSVMLPKIESLNKSTLQYSQIGKGSTASNVKRGLHVGAIPSQHISDIAIDATVIHAVLRNPDQFEISRADLQQKKRDGKTGRLILFVVDASGSMAARKRMEAVKGTVLSLLKEAYEKRDSVGVISFRGIEAQLLLLPPTQSIALAEEAMLTLPTGGRTPLANALQMAVQVLSNMHHQKNEHLLLVILTDGKANVPLAGTAGDPWSQTLVQAAQLKKLNIQSLVLNSESGYFNLDKAEHLAAALGGQYLSLDEMSEAQLTPVINQLF